MKKILETIRIALSGEEKNFTSGSINRAIVLLSIPMILEMVMESLFAIVDVYFVGKVSTEAVATVGLTESVITIIYSLAMGLAMASTAMISRRIGENKPEEAASAAMQAILMAVIVSIILGILGFIYAESILRMLGGSDHLIESGLWYTKILLGTNIVITLLFVLNAVFRGAGDASIAMRTLWIANGLNILLDPLFIFGIGFFPELGVAGAAVATTIGRSVGVSYQCYMLWKGTGVIRILKRHFVIVWATIIKLGDVALTGAWQWIVASASWIFLMKIIAEFGDSVIAGYTISIRILIFTILPSWGMANAAATLVGQNLGANLPGRAEKSVWRTSWLNTFFLGSIGIFLFIFSQEVVSIFTSDVLAIETGVLSLRVFCIGYVFFAPAMVISQAFNGAGDTRTPLYINFFCFWLTEIPLAYFLAKTINWGPSGVFWAIAIAEALMGIILIVMFKRGKWKTMEI
ncbi:MAG: MATE family efflux transporter [Saprospiraceae bacterium]|jgi:putative MATE family efflux protein|nr:MATE family efflux transporter [Saprospiraceae bacterium]